MFRETRFRNTLSICKHKSTKKKIPRGKFVFGKIRLC